VSTGRVDDETSVVEAFRAGDEGALAGLYERWSPLVYSLALRTLGDPEAADEVTRRVFTQAWAERQAFDPAQGRFTDRLVDLSCRIILDSGPDVEGRGVAVDGSATDPSSPGASRPALLAERLLVADQLTRLDPTPRQVLQMVLDDDLTHAEIAGRTGLSLDEVKTQVADALITLRKRLEADPDAH